ncbi:MAG: FAD synthetase [Rikenellaceae bacterium]
MLVFKGVETLIDLGHTVATVGSFDGVHSGHSALLTTLRQSAQSSGCKSVVVSLTPHPRVILSRAEGLELLTCDEEKILLLEQQGIDALLLLEFTEEFSRLSYERFLCDYLLAPLKMQQLIVGFNHRLGHDAAGHNKLKEMAKRYNFEVTQTQEQIDSQAKISSTTIRERLAAGDIATANRLLSHPYLIIGTTNSEGLVQIDEPLKLIPPAGKYRCTIGEKESVVAIDSQRRVWCEQRSARVEINFISALK